LYTDKNALLQFEPKNNSFLSSNLSEPTDLAVDPNSHALYWTDAGMDGIYRVKHDGGRPELVRGDIAEATVSISNT
jgi:hypothetical protein